eukprot:51628-Amphidinium_carterae.1
MFALLYARAVESVVATKRFQLWDSLLADIAYSDRAVALDDSGSFRLAEPSGRYPLLWEK